MGLPISALPFYLYVKSKTIKTCLQVTFQSWVPPSSSRPLTCKLTHYEKASCKELREPPAPTLGAVLCRLISPSAPLSLPVGAAASGTVMVVTFLSWLPVPLSPPTPARLNRLCAPGGQGAISLLTSVHPVPGTEPGTQEGHAGARPQVRVGSCLRRGLGQSRNIAA